jgi:hypothetical protein
MSEGATQSTLDDSHRLNVQEFSAGDIPVDADHTGAIEMHSLKWDLFSRVHLCTNTKKLYQITSNNPMVALTVDLTAMPTTTVLTEKHMLVALENGKINWMKIDMPVYGEDENQFISFEQARDGESTNIEKDYDFIEKLHGDSNHDAAPVQYMYYSRQHDRLILGSEDGVLALLPEAAEKQEYDQDEEENENQKEKQTI